MKGKAVAVFDSPGIDAAALENVLVLVGEVAANDGDYAHVGEKAG
jgi:hypothetical protein